MLVCSWCYIFPYCSTASWLVLDVTWNSLLGVTPATSMKIGRVWCWELEPLFLFMFVFLDFLLYFSFIFLQSSHLLSCLWDYNFIWWSMVFSWLVGVWTNHNQGHLVTQAWISYWCSENWTGDFLSIISEKYHVLPSNSSITHVVGKAWQWRLTAYLHVRLLQQLQNLLYFSLRTTFDEYFRANACRGPYQPEITSH